MHPSNIKELFDHTRFYYPKTWEQYREWYEQMIQADERKNAKIAELEAKVAELEAKLNQKEGRE